MVAVFSIFASLSVIEFKFFGVTMAAAVLIDATIVRGVLLLAVVALLGDRAWSMPGRRRRTPGPPAPGQVIAGNWQAPPSVLNKRAAPGILQAIASQLNNRNAPFLR